MEASLGRMLSAIHSIEKGTGMNSAKRISFCLVAAVIVAACLPASAASDSITLTVETDQAKYYPDEPIQINVTAHNSGFFDEILQFSSSRQGYYIMDDVYEFPSFVFPFPSAQLVPAQGSYTWSYDHDWDRYDLSLGEHSVIGRAQPVSNNPAVTFEIVEPKYWLGDINHDLAVDIIDLNIVLIRFGEVIPPGPIPDPADVNGDWEVNILDLNAVLIDWGKTGYAPK